MRRRWLCLEFKERIAIWPDITISIYMEWFEQTQTAGWGIVGGEQRAKVNRGVLKSVNRTGNGIFFYWSGLSDYWDGSGRPRAVVIDWFRDPKLYLKHSYFRVKINSALFSFARLSETKNDRWPKFPTERATSFSVRSYYCKSYRERKEKFRDGLYVLRKRSKWLCFPLLLRYITTKKNATLPRN